LSSLAVLFLHHICVVLDLTFSRFLDSPLKSTPLPPFGISKAFPLLTLFYGEMAHDPTFVFPIISTPPSSQLDDAYIDTVVDQVIELDAFLDKILQYPPTYLPPSGPSQSPIVIKDKLAGPSNPIVIEDEPTSPSEIKALLKERKKFLSLHTRNDANVDRWWRSFIMAPPKEQEKYCRDNWAPLDNEGTLKDLKWAASHWVDFTETRFNRLNWKAASEKDGISDEKLAKWVKEDSEEAKRQMPKKIMRMREIEVESLKEGRKNYRMNIKMKRDRRNGLGKRGRDKEEKVEAEMGSFVEPRKKQRIEEPTAPIKSPSAIETPSDTQEMDEDGPDVDELERLIYEEFKKDELVDSNDDEEELDENEDSRGLFSEEEAEDDTRNNTQDAIGEITGEVWEFRGKTDMIMNLKPILNESLKCWVAGSE
jgi:hypothetical protein